MWLPLFLLNHRSRTFHSQESASLNPTFYAPSGCIPHTWGPVLLCDLASFLWLSVVSVCSRSQPLCRHFLFGTGFTELSQGLFQVESLRSAWIRMALCFLSVSSNQIPRFCLSASVFFSNDFSAGYDPFWFTSPVWGSSGDPGCLPHRYHPFWLQYSISLWFCQ